MTRKILHRRLTPNLTTLIPIAILIPNIFEHLKFLSGTWGIPWIDPPDGLFGDAVNLRRGRVGLGFQFFEKNF